MDFLCCCPKLKCHNRQRGLVVRMQFDPHWGRTAIWHDTPANPPCQRTQFSILPEAHILYDILATYRRAKQFGSKTGFFYATEDDLLAFFQSFARRHVADIVARAGNSTALVLKDPSFIQSLGEAAAVFPGSITVRLSQGSSATLPPPS